MHPATGAADDGIRIGCSGAPVDNTAFASAQCAPRTCGRRGAPANPSCNALLCCGMQQSDSTGLEGRRLVGTLCTTSRGTDGVRMMWWQRQWYDVAHRAPRRARASCALCQARVQRCKPVGCPATGHRHGKRLLVPVEHEVAHVCRRRGACCSAVQKKRGLGWAGHA